MTFSRPGQYVDEVLLATNVETNSTEAVAAIVGAGKRGPIKPKRLTSWTDALRAFGGFTGIAADDTLLQAIYDTFSTGSHIVHACRVAGSGAAAATLPFSLGSAPGINEVQVVTITGAPTGGTFTLTFDGDETDPIAYNATAAAVQTAFLALPSVGAGNATVTGSAGGPYTFTFLGDLASSNVAAITADDSALTGGTTPAVGVAAGPEGSSGTAAVDISAVNPGVWGNRLYVEVQTSATDPLRFNLVVREVPVGVTTLTNAHIVERWTELSLNPADARYLLNVLNSPVSPSSHLTVALRPGYTYTADDTLAATVAGGAKLAGGLDGSAATKTEYMNAVYALDDVSQPLVLNLPGVTTLSIITAVADYADASRTRQDNGEPGRGDVFVVVDTAAGVDADAAISTIGTYPTSDYLAAYYPQIVVSDPSNSVAGSTKLVPQGPSVVGRYMATDAARGAFKSPAGTTDGLLPNVVALDPAATLKNPDLDALNNAGVNAIKLIPNRGFCIFGARTLKSSYITRYVAPRRTIIGVRAELLEETAFAVFENNDQFLWSHLFSVADRICRELHTAGGLRGGSPDEAYYVKCDAENNTLATIEQGEVHLEVGLALERPAEFVVIQIAQREGGGTAIDSTSV